MWTVVDDNVRNYNVRNVRQKQNANIKIAVNLTRQCQFIGKVLLKL